MSAAGATFASCEAVPRNPSAIARSQRLYAPFGTVWIPCIVSLPRHARETDNPAYPPPFEQRCRDLWREHALGAIAVGMTVVWQ